MFAIESIATVTNIFKVKQFEMLISRKAVRAGAKVLKDFQNFVFKFIFVFWNANDH